MPSSIVSGRYGDSFYKTRHQETLEAARIILNLTVSFLPPIQSVVDVGCGVGTWLTVAQELGIKTVYGIDGPWVPLQYRQIPETCFVEADITKRFPYMSRYDLALSLEVAEHLEESRADSFIHYLTGLSDIVLFSAAIPGQGGEDHVNEQWPDYWQAKFAQAGYQVFDVIRGKIWNMPNIYFWYKQNILLFVRTTKTDGLRIDKTETCHPLALVHPELFTLRCGI